MAVSENSGFSPSIIHFKRVFHYKPSILGYHYFWKHPYIDLLQHTPAKTPKFDQKPCTFFPDFFGWGTNKLWPSTSSAVSGPTNKAMERIQEDAWDKLWDEAISEVFDLHLLRERYARWKKSSKKRAHINKRNK